MIPIGETHREYAKEVADKLDAAGIRVTVDDRNEKMGYKIRQAQLEKVPYMLVVGAKEMEDGTVSVRARHEDKGGVKSVEDFLTQIKEEIACRES